VSSDENDMTVAAPPRRPPRFEDPADLDALEALIEEARRRARRRRRLQGGGALLVLATGAAAFFGFGNGGRSRAPHPSAGDVSLPQIKRIPPNEIRNGAITLMDVRTIAPGEGPPGWYGVSTLGRDGRLRTIVRCPHRVDWCGEVEGIAWAPDGRWLALSVTSFASANPYNGLHVVNPRTGADRLVVPCRPGACDWVDLSWSPDGSRLAYVANGSIFVIGAYSGRTRLHADLPGTLSSPSWSPDGGSIGFAHAWRRRSSVYVTRLDGTGRRLLTRHAAAPAWSPLGSAIAYRTRCGVKLMTPNGKDVTPRSAFRCNHIGFPGPPVWSPDGHRIALARKTTRGMGAAKAGTYVMNADGTDLTRLTPKTIGVWMGKEPRPAWRPLPRTR
jgi:hypothetical protein